MTASTGAAREAGVMDKPHFVGTTAEFKRSWLTPALRSDIRLILLALIDAGTHWSEEYSNDLAGREAVEWLVGPDRHEETLAAFDRLAETFPTTIPTDQSS